MECPKCGNEVKETDKRCPYCHKVLQIECPVCHRFNRTAVCEECGNVIIVKCHNCGTPGPNTGKCRKCGFPTYKSVIMNEAETEEYACLAITFPNIEDLRPALKNKQIFNKFKKKLKQALFTYAANQDNRCQLFGETYVIKYYKEFSFTSSVKKAVKSAIELLNKIGGISYKLKRGKNVRLHCKMTILKKTFETDNNEFNTGLNIKLIKDTTEEKYTDGLQLITDQYINNVIQRDYKLEMIYSSQVGDELLMFYEFPLEDQIVPIVIEDKKEEKSILKGPANLPKIKIDDDEDALHELLYSNKAIDIEPEGQFLSVAAHNIYKALSELLVSHCFITLKTTERRDLPSGDVTQFLQGKFGRGVCHIVCTEEFKYKPYMFFKEFLSQLLHIDLKQENQEQMIKSSLSGMDSSGILANLLLNQPSEDMDPDTSYISYMRELRTLLANQKNIVLYVENFDLIDETSLKIINDYISTIITVEDLTLTFIVTVRSEYSVYKNIPKLLHSSFYREINVTKGDFNAFLATIPDDIEEIRDTFYISKLEERSAGSLLYFKNEFQYLRDSNVFLTFEGKLMINAEKTLIFPGSIQELLSKRFTSLPENEGLVMAYTTLMLGYAHFNILAKLGIENLSDAINSLVSKGLIICIDEIVYINNFRIFEESLNKVLDIEVKKTLINNLFKDIKYVNYKLLDTIGDMNSKLTYVYEDALNNLDFGDFNSYLNCAKLFFQLIEDNEIKDETILEQKNELFSILVNHLNRYPSTKVYSISKTIMSNAVARNDDKTILNVSNLVLDSALSGEDYVLAQQCIQNILTRILNPKLVPEGVDMVPQVILYFCINASISFHLAHYNQSMSICDKILSSVTPELLSGLEANNLSKDEFMSYVTDALVYSALSRIIICDGTLAEYLNSVKEHLGQELYSSAYLVLMESILHNAEYDVESMPMPDDAVSMFISNIAQAFKHFDEGYNTFAQNIYKAKLSAQDGKFSILSLLCDLFIGYSYQKLSLENSTSFKKCESIYDDVYRTAQRSGFRSVMLITTWFKATLLKDKEMFDEAYELVLAVSNAIKRQRIKNRLLSVLTYILALNIASKIPSRKADIPIIVYRITYEAEKYGFEEYYRFIEDQRVLDPEYMTEFSEQIKAEQEAIEAENLAEAQADAAEEDGQILPDEGAVPSENQEEQTQDQ